MVDSFFLGRCASSREMPKSTRAKHRPVTDAGLSEYDGASVRRGDERRADHVDELLQIRRLGAKGLYKLVETSRIDISDGDGADVRGFLERLPLHGDVCPGPPAEWLSWWHPRAG